MCYYSDSLEVLLLGLVHYNQDSLVQNFCIYFYTVLRNAFMFLFFKLFKQNFLDPN